MTTVYAKFIHGGRINTVALVEGLAVEEVSNLLKTVFNINGTIVGILAEKGLVIPISLVCKSPQVIPNGVCKILVNGVPVPAAAPTVSNAASTATNETAALKSFSSVAANVSTKSVDSEPYSLGVDSVQESEGPVEQVIQEILRFLQSLQQQQVLSHLQFTLLHRLLRSNSTLLFAAYSVAISANDSEYFAEIAKDLANSLLTEQGRSACEAQDEVLQVCDQLYLNERITENQLLYLRHLVLIREEAVARVYDDFQEHQHVPLLAKALFDLANSHPFKREKKNVSQQTQTMTQTLSQKSLRAQRERQQREYERESVPSVDEDRGSEGLEEYDESERERDRDSEAETATQSSAGNTSLAVSVARKTRGLTGVASLLSRAGVLSKTETNVLLEMIANENEFVLAAYELYEQNRDLDELQDTLERCVRLEIRKRVTDLQEEELESLQRDRQRQRERERESDLRRAQAEAEADEVLYEDESKSARESDAEMRIVDSDASDSESDEDEDEKNALATRLNKQAQAQADEEREGEEDFGLEDISLDAILQSLDIDENRWRSRVPDLFVQTVFIAVIRAQLEREQAVALCDLFLGRYDLVLAAWEVFLVQKDRLDLLDTLRRIVRDLDLNSMRPAKSGKSKSTGSTSGAVSVSSTMSVTSPKSLASSSSSSSSSASTSPESAAPVKPSPTRNAAPATASTASAESASASNAAVQAAKNEALQAVRNAKRELLKHSLEMMVKQGLATAENASNLFARYLEGDVLVEAAIESYANDRDVAEFLDTLQILCAHSVEEIDTMMKSAAAAELRKQREEEQEQQPQSQQQRPSSAPMSVSRQELALMQVTDIVKEMLKTDVIGPAVAQAFERLIKARDTRLIAAYEQYEQTKNGAALVDSLLRVVIESVEGPQRAPASVAQEREKPSPARASPQKSPATAAAAQRAQEREREAEKQRQQEEEEGGESASILDKADQKKIVEILYRARAITLEQYDALSQLVDQGNSIVTRIFSAYEQDKNVYALMDALKQLDVTPAKAASPAKAPSPQKSSPQKSPVLAQDDDEEEDDEEDDGDFVEARFMQIVQTMSLSDLETAALRLAIAENDPSIRSAIEQFRNGLDEQRLVQAMREAAQGVIARTLQAKHGIDMQQMMQMQMDMENDEDEEEEEEDEDAQNEQDKEDGEVSDDEASSGNQEDEGEDNDGDEEEDEDAVEDNDEENDEQDEQKDGSDGDEEEEEEDNEDEDEGNKSDDEGGDGDEDEDNEDDENFNGNSLITPQRARESVFPILVHELVKENILSQGAGEILLQRFEDGNTVINAALDVYDQDSDMAKLVDTLQTFVDDVTGNDN